MDDQVEGFEVLARDGAVGPAMYPVGDGERAILLIRTGRWPRRRVRAIPANAVRRVDPEARTVEIDRTRAQVRAAPSLPAGLRWEPPPSVGQIMYFQDRIWGR